MLSGIITVANNNIVATKYQLFWYLPCGVKRIANLTAGQTLIMGRKTYDLIGKHFSFAKIIVITKSKNYKNTDRISYIYNLDEINDLIFDDKEYFVIGGKQIFELLSPYISKLYFTVIEECFDGEPIVDSIFSDSQWKTIEIERGAIEGTDSLTYETKPIYYQFLTLKKLFNKQFCNKIKSYSISQDNICCIFNCKLDCPYWKD